MFTEVTNRWRVAVVNVNMPIGGEEKLVPNMEEIHSSFLP